MHHNVIVDLTPEHRLLLWVQKLPAKKFRLMQDFHRTHSVSLNPSLVKTVIVCQSAGNRIEKKGIYDLFNDSIQINEF